MEGISLENIGLGAASEQFDHELYKVLENVLDPNTEATKARTINLKVTIKPRETRDLCSFEIQTTSKLAPVRAFISQIGVGEEGGKVIAREYTQQPLPMTSGKPETKISAIGGGRS